MKSRRKRCCVVFLQPHLQLWTHSRNILSVTVRYSWQDLSIKVNSYFCTCEWREVWSNRERNKCGSLNQYNKRHCLCHQRVAGCFLRVSCNLFTFIVWVQMAVSNQKIAVASLVTLTLWGIYLFTTIEQKPSQRSPPIALAGEKVRGTISQSLIEFINRHLSSWFLILKVSSDQRRR